MSAGRHFRLLAAVHVFMLRNDQVLLLRRYNTGYEDGKFSVPAGHLDGDETVLSAARREVLEEVGIELSDHDLAVVGVMHRRSDDERVDFFLAAERWRGEPVNLEPEKCDLLAWYALDGLPANTVPYVCRALANYRRGRWFDSFGWDSPLAGPDAP